MAIHEYDVGAYKVRSCPVCGTSRIPDIRRSSGSRPSVTTGSGVGSQKRVLFHDTWCDALTGRCETCHQDILIFYDPKSNKCYAADWNTPEIQAIKREVWNVETECVFCQWEHLINRRDTIEVNRSDGE